MSTEEHSGGTYPKKAITFTSMPSNVTITDMVLMNEGQVVGRVKLTGGEWESEHSCIYPMNPGPDADQCWICPACSKRHELNVETWYEPEEI